MSLKKWIVSTLAMMVVVTSLVGCSGPTGSSDKTTITVGTTGQTPGVSEPGDDPSKDGGVQGMDIDIINEVAKRNNWEVKWKVAPVDALFGMLDNGQVTTIANTIAINEKRKEKYNFDEPYAYGSYSFVAKKGAFSLDNINSLKGKTISVLANGDQKISLEDMNTKHQLGANILALDDNGAVLQAMLNGQSEVAYIGTSAAALANKSLNLDLQMFDPGDTNFKLVHPFLKTADADKIREQMDKTLKEMRDDGTLTKISMKWFGKDVTIEPTKKV